MSVDGVVVIVDVEVGGYVVAVEFIETVVVVVEVVDWMIKLLVVAITPPLS